MRSSLTAAGLVACLVVATGSARAQPADADTGLEPGRERAPLTPNTDASVRVHGAPESTAHSAAGAGRTPSGEPAGSSLVKDIVGDYGTFFRRRDTYLTLGVGLVTSLGAKPLDESIRDSDFNGESPPGDGSVHDRLLDAGEHVGSALVQVGGAFATYGVGSALGRPSIMALGRDLVRAQALTQGLTQALKYSIGRTRPDGSSRRSFPSGHASGTFASAAVLNRHFGWKIGIPAFGVASYVAASRLSENKHYLSDVVFGAAIGVAAGRTVTFRVGSTRVEASPAVVPGGVAVQVSALGW